MVDVTTAETYMIYAECNKIYFTNAHSLFFYIQGISGGIVNSLGGGSMDYSE